MAFPRASISSSIQSMAQSGTTQGTISTRASTALYIPLPPAPRRFIVHIDLSRFIITPTSVTPRFPQVPQTDLPQADMQTQTQDQSMPPPPSRRPAAPTPQRPEATLSARRQSNVPRNGPVFSTASEEPTMSPEKRMQVSAWLDTQRRIKPGEYVQWEEAVFEEDEIDVEQLSEQERETLAWLEKHEAWKDSWRNGSGVPFASFVWPPEKEDEEMN